jgi:predicted nucleic acid-binding protein
VKAYLDSGIFIDYLVNRGHAGPYLRTSDRRGRSPSQLGSDAEACLARLAADHQALTSSLTCYEVEEAMYRELKRSASGVADGGRYLIPAARAVLTQTLMTIEAFGIELVELTQDVVLTQCRDIALQMKGVRAADALHVTTALLHDADLLLSADAGILRLDGEFKTITGKALRCLDTDSGMGLLEGRHQSN